MVEKNTSPAKGQNMRSSESSPGAPGTPKLSGAYILQLCHRGELQSASASGPGGVALWCQPRFRKGLHSSTLPQEGAAEYFCFRAWCQLGPPEGQGQNAGFLGPSSHDLGTPKYSYEAKANGRRFALAATCRNGHHFYKTELYHIKR